MKKTEENRYPNAAVLFKFCKEALEMRYEGNVKVIDQDVGAILGYDPADCSHWKKGKKNIRALATIRTIAEHLNVDDRLLIDITAGRVGYEEAVFEYKGYGAFALAGKHLENLKKEYFRNPAKYESESSGLTFEDLFDTNRPAVAEMVAKVLEKANIQEAPIYLPEIAKAYPCFVLEHNSELETSHQVVKSTDGLVTTFKYKTAESRPFMRYLMAKEFFKSLILSKNPVAEKFAKSPDEILDIQANMFVSMLLLPKNLLKHEVERIDSSFDIINQLAETFWVSKALMNQRLKDFLEFSN